MIEDFLVVGGMALFFLCFGLYNWFHPFMGTVGLKIRVDPEELDPVRLTLVRVVSVMMVGVGLVLLDRACGGFIYVIPLMSW